MKDYSVQLDIEKDFYHPEIDLHHRTVCLYANEFKGKCENLRFYNDGLTLEEGKTHGVFISDSIECDSFDVMIASWNCKSLGGTVSVSVSPDGNEWFSWGVWSDTAGISASASSKSDLGELDIDILTLKEKHTSFIFRIELKAIENAPVLYSVSFAINSESGRLPKADRLFVENRVNTRIQGTVAVIGGRICSPTSVSMAMEYHGIDSSMQDVAAAVYDNGKDIYGNWSFNASFPAFHNFNSFFDLYDAEALKYALSCGFPVACSVKIQKGQLAKSGYPDRSTNGHLLLVTGYITKNDNTWLYINDPAVPSGKITVLLSEFMDIWRFGGAVYVIQPKPEKFITHLENGMPVIADYVAKNRINRRYERGSVGAKYVVIHNTDNWRTGAGAKAHSQYLKSFEQGQRPLAWHYTVDDEAIYKSLPEEEAAYHAGDGAEGEGNLYGIGIEICLNKQPRGEKPSEAFIKAVKNTAALTAELMVKYSLPVENVRQHNAFSGKNCPSCMRENGMWDEFISDVIAHYEHITSSNYKIKI